MAKKKGKGARVNIQEACTVCKRINYTSQKNKKNDPERLEQPKYCSFCRVHTPHKETK
jgi:large subunit ribosomal protein L33